jgi:hypothetical protein
MWQNTRDTSTFGSQVHGVHAIVVASTLKKKIMESVMFEEAERT